MKISIFYKILILKFDIKKIIQSYQAIRRQKKIYNKSVKVTFIVFFNLFPYLILRALI